MWRDVQPGCGDLCLQPVGHAEGEPAQVLLTPKMGAADRLGRHCNAATAFLERQADRWGGAVSIPQAFRVALLRAESRKPSTYRHHVMLHGMFLPFRQQNPDRVEVMHPRFVPFDDLAQGLCHEVHSVGPLHQRSLARIGAVVNEFLWPFMRRDRQQRRSVIAVFAEFGMEFLAHVEDVDLEHLVGLAVAVERPVIGEDVARRVLRGQAGDLPGVEMGRKSGVVSAKRAFRGEGVEIGREEDCPYHPGPSKKELRLTLAYAIDQ